MSVTESPLGEETFLGVWFDRHGRMAVNMNLAVRPTDKAQVSRMLGNCTMVVGSLAAWCQQYLVTLDGEEARIVQSLMAMPMGAGKEPS